MRLWRLAIELRGPSGPATLTMPQLLMLRAVEREKEKALSVRLFEAFAAAQADKDGMDKFLDAKRSC
ncbi:hypothetical protein [Devosia nitrariae]|uniref:Uncharacterized protein n=1 Tax=Devosia nitrariae TaxID=2071872 RepID=A0ABQ5W1J4_9HYPH|nr:hypothetical protein [Devosia nitrariae]GLQ53596.1 hypothetical protein GCM10010862_08550 [Devosia nitrariae]